MIDYHSLYQWLNELNVEAWSAQLPEQIEAALAPHVHGNILDWQKTIKNLPELRPRFINLDADAVTIGRTDEITELQQIELRAALWKLFPWRKGPYEIYGIPLDTEWRSDWKWQRLQQYISPLTYRVVLDVGSGNGYHCWRMAGSGAKLVIGIDHTLLNVMQFQLIKKLHGPAPVYVLPLGIEALPANLNLFDTVFSMGVLYHQRSPIEHLQMLKDCMNSDGELVLETLIIEGKQGEVLVPEGRYARMRNVWFIPSADTLMSWMRRCGFKNIRLVDVNQTSIEEQRSTEWMPFQSLQDFLDPENPNLTCEGHPAPRRGIFIANR